ncbi:MAG: hypothetical protein WDN25_00320 [Acetobacteraceae bacterium]
MTAATRRWPLRAVVVLLLAGASPARAVPVFPANGTGLMDPAAFGYVSRTVLAFAQMNAMTDAFSLESGRTDTSQGTDLTGGSGRKLPGTAGRSVFVMWHRVSGEPLGRPTATGTLSGIVSKPPVARTPGIAGPAPRCDLGRDDAEAPLPASVAPPSRPPAPAPAIALRDGFPTFFAALCADRATVHRAAASSPAAPSGTVSGGRVLPDGRRPRPR